jgi:hypothetical protein
VRGNGNTYPQLGRFLMGKNWRQAQGFHCPVAEHALSPEVLQFISTHIRSVEEVEILSLLAANPAKSWSVQEIYRAIKTAERSIGERLRGFVSANLVVEEVEMRFKFSSVNPQALQTVLAMARAYRERPVTVIETIYSRAPGAAQSFAEAFRFRKDK